ncbi:MAG: response regulator [Nitrospiraceae bacterium]|nr:response regulator [Nitrospiraceae bacterium]
MELKRILLVEDDPRDIELTIEAFETHSLANEIMIAHDGAEALDLLQRRGKFETMPGGNPALILLDLKMPKVDGLEVLRAVRADDNLKLIPVIVLTTSREERDIIESYNLGVNAYVLKPVGFEEFVEAVREIGLFWAVLNEPPPRTMSTD